MKKEGERWRGDGVVGEGVGRVKGERGVGSNGGGGVMKGGSDGREREWSGGGREWSGVMEGGRVRKGVMLCDGGW